MAGFLSVNKSDKMFETWVTQKPDNNLLGTDNQKPLIKSKCTIFDTESLTD